MVEAEAIDFAMLDVNLNVEKSYPVADALTVRGIPFVFSSGYNKDSLPDSYKNFPIMQKPYEQKMLAANLAKFLVTKTPLP